MINKIPIIVFSTDTYSDLWPLRFKNFEEQGVFKSHIPILITETKEFDYPNLITIKTKNINWSDSAITACKKLLKMNFEYALFTFDDLLIKKIDLKSIIDLQKIAINNRVDSLKFYTHEKPNYHNEKYGYFHYKSHYLCVFTFSLWNISKALELLKSGESAWEFEHYAPTRCDSNSKHFSVYKSRVKLVNSIIKSKVDTFVMNINCMFREKKILLKNRSSINFFISIRIQFARLILKIIYLFPNSFSNSLLTFKRKFF